MRMVGVGARVDADATLERRAQFTGPELNMRDWGLMGKTKTNKTIVFLIIAPEPHCAPLLQNGRLVPEGT